MKDKVNNDNAVGIQTYKIIRDMIIKGTFKPGQKLVQTDLIAKLGISRTPLQRALSMLVCDNLVEQIPHKGIFVKKLSKEDLLSVFEVRKRLEPYAAGLAAKKITQEQVNELKNINKEMEKDLSSITAKKFNLLDTQFHALIIESADDHILEKVLTQFLPFMHSLGNLLSFDHSLKDHIDITKALEEHDSEIASMTMLAHNFSKTKDELNEIIERMNTV